MTRGWQTYGRSTRDRRRKKTRPQRQQGEPQRQAPIKQAPAQRTESARPAASSSGWRPPSRASVAQTIRPEDYQYVYHDLRRIAVLAGSIFIVLIALSFVIK